MFRLILTFLALGFIMATVAFANPPGFTPGFPGEEPPGFTPGFPGTEPPASCPDGCPREPADVRADPVEPNAPSTPRAWSGCVSPKVSLTGVVCH